MAAREVLPDEQAPLIVVGSDAEVRRLTGGEMRAVTRKALLAGLREGLVPDAVPASPLAVEVAVSGLLVEIAKTTPWLSRIVERGGRALADLVLAVVRALAEARRMLWFEPLMSRRAMESPLERGALLLADVASSLDRALARAGLVDPTAEAEIVARAIVRASPSDVALAVGARKVVAAGISSWLPADLVLWRALDAKLSFAGGSATIELVAFDRPLDAERERDPLERCMDAVAEALDGAPRTRALAPVLGDLRFVESAPEGLNAYVEVRRADSARSQASAVAQAVHAALGGGARVDEVAVVVPDAASLDSPSSDEHSEEGRDARASIRRALEDAGIPVHATLPDAPAAGGLLSFALEALGVADAGVPRLAFATLLRSRYLDAIRITGIAEGGEADAALVALARVLRATPAVAGEGPADALAATLARRIAGLLARARTGKTREEHAAHAGRLFRDLGIATRPGPGARGHLAQDSPAHGVVRAEIVSFARDTREEARLWAVLGDYARAASRLDAPGTLCSFDSFRFELEHALAREDPPSEACAAGAVRVCAWEDLPSRSFALLVVADAHEGALVAPGRDTSLLTAPLRARLTEALDPALRASAHMALSTSNVALLAAAAHASTRIVFAYRARDEAGGALAPHPLVAWLEREGAHVEVWRDKVTTDRPITEREYDLALLARSPEDAVQRKPQAARRAAIETRREQVAGVPSPGAADGASIFTMSEPFRAILREETGGMDRPMSVTSLDGFGSCRFQGFASQVLRARVPLERADAVDAREEGTLLHAALAAAFRATRDQWSARPRDAGAIRARAERAADGLLSQSAAATGLRRAALDAVRKDVLRVVEWSLADEAWDFAYAEAVFGRGKEGWREAVLRDARTTLRLRGSIDRVDVAHGRAQLRVIDYKRSADSARRFTDALGETSFQIAAYGRAASVALGLAAPVGLYLPARRLPLAFRAKGAPAAWASAHEELEGTPRFERRALDLIEKVRQGDVAPRPVEPDVCETCDYDGACRKPRFVIAALSGDEHETSKGEGP